MIFGAKGLGKLALEIFDQNNIITTCFLDDDESLHDTQIGEVSVLGNISDASLIESLKVGSEVFVALDEQEFRKTVIEDLIEQHKLMPVNCLHPQAIISSNAQLGHGNLINGGASLGPFSKIGNHCQIHANALVDFGVILEDFVQVGAGAIIGSETEVAKGAFIGTGAVLVPGIKVGKNARIGAGSVVISNVEEGETLFGNPAKAI